MYQHCVCLTTCQCCHVNTCAISTKCPITELCFGIMEADAELPLLLTSLLLPLLSPLPRSSSPSTFWSFRLALLATLDGGALGAVEYSQIFDMSDFSRSHSHSKYFCVSLEIK